jgi:hypothetical protein
LRLREGENRYAIGICDIIRNGERTFLVATLAEETAGTPRAGSRTPIISYDVKTRAPQLESWA